ncbi:MAG: pyroglutamyl-peptidase I [Candidatus Heimdallarchaeota archaeon]|nr:pyroglutamyl-peptidase I [Candidatus Heimdallarchaeota archaeon]MCK4973197.1 pyroglutamyl-peptidase I [Candidatus Heimdallarchaeota archaeon]
MSKKIILTGFEPFGGSDVNPSILACQSLSKKTVEGYEIKAIEIPLRYKEIKHNIESVLIKEKPEIVICTGQSSRSVISLERIAINTASLEKSAYSCGTKPMDEILETNGRAGYFSTLPIRKIKDCLEENKIPCEISNSAGTFGCNQIFYHLMQFINNNEINIPAGFIHVPSLPEQVIGKNFPSMTLELIIQALEIAIITTIKHLHEDNIE